MKAQYVEEYAKILYASMRGEQTFFISPEEIETAWKFTDSIIDGWKRNLIPLKEYEPGATPLWVTLQSAPDFLPPPPAMELRAGEVGIIGLGKMGANIARRLHSKKWRVVSFDKNPDAIKELELEGLVGAEFFKRAGRKIIKTSPYLAYVSA